MLLFAALITGLVVDPADARVAGAKVELRSSPGAEPIRIVLSNSEGSFTIPDVAPGQYHLRITQHGFQALRLGPIALVEGETKRLPDSMLRLSRKMDSLYCNRRFAAPRCKRTPSQQSLLRGNSTAAEGLLTLTGGTREFTATVKPDGSFQFDNLPPGRYTLHAVFPGYAPFEIKRLRIPANSAIEIEGWIDTPECPPAAECPTFRRVLRDDEHLKNTICL